MSVFTRYCARCQRQTVGEGYDGPRAPGETYAGRCYECGSSSWANGKRAELPEVTRPTVAGARIPEIPGQLGLEIEATP